MKKKTANLKIVDTQAKDETQQQEAEARDYKITRAEIVERVHEIRRQFEATCNVYRGAMFHNCDMDNDLNPNESGLIDKLAGWLNPQLPKLYQACCDADKPGDATELYFNCLETAYQIGVFMGVIATTDSPSEIDKAEKGLIFISARPWLIKE